MRKLDGLYRLDALALGGRRAEVLLDLDLVCTLPAVHGYMVFQAALVGEGLSAAWLAANVRLLARVLAHVHLQCRAADKCLVADRARERALTSMPRHVVQQVTLRDKALAAVTEITGVWALACVRTHVGLQVSLLGKHLVATLMLAEERDGSPG